MKKILLIVLALGTLVGCQATDKGEERVKMEKNSTEVLYDLAVKDRGNVILFNLTVKNNGNKPVTFKFSSSQKYDFEVLKDGRFVWKWAEGMMFTMALQEQTLKPGQKEIYSVEWDKKDREGHMVSPGEYKIIAYFLGESRDKPVAEKRFIIK